jgi:hypothetical protein
MTEENLDKNRSMEISYPPHEHSRERFFGTKLTNRIVKKRNQGEDA